FHGNLLTSFSLICSAGSAPCSLLWSLSYFHSFILTDICPSRIATPATLEVIDPTNASASLRARDWQAILPVDYRKVRPPLGRDEMNRQNIHCGMHRRTA